MRNLVVFDLDGTLLETSAIDDRCSIAAWREEFSIDCSCVDVPLVSSDGRSSREEIVRQAIRLALPERDDAGSPRIVLVGDAPWDVNTARRLSLPFLGIAHGEKRKRLLASGAEHVLADFSDFSTVASALQQAVVPCPME